MAGPLLRYAKVSQDVSRTATWTVTGGTEDPAYPATKLNGRDPTDPAKLTTTTGKWRADLTASPPAIVGVALIHTNLLPGLEVRLQGSAASDFSSLSVNTVITTPALKNNWPVNPVLIFAAQTYRYWRINVVGTNPVAVSIGHVALLTAVQSFAWAQAEIQWTDTIPTWDDVTELDVPMNLDLLTQLRACQFDTINDATAQAALDDWWFDARGINLPFVVIPNVDVNECYYMTFQEKTKEVTANKSIRLLRVKLKEFGRGMRPTPWFV